MAHVRVAIVEVMGWVLLAATGLGPGGCGDDQDVVDAQSPADHLEPIELDITPSRADFGAVRMGTATAPKTFTVTHVSGPATSPLKVQLFSGDALDFRVSTDQCTGKSLDASDACTIEVELAPVCEGPLTTLLRVWDSRGFPEVQARLDGEGIPIRR